VTGRVYDVSVLLQEAVDAYALDINHSANALKLAEKSLEVAADVISEDAANRKALGSANHVIENVVTLLDHHLPSASVCEKGLNVVRLLCRHESDRSTQVTVNVEALGAAGACAVVVNALNAHPSNVAVATQVIITHLLIA
jgi:hypothetical protein